MCAVGIGLALRLSRTAATGRLVMAETLVADLPGTLAAWQAGTVDTLNARAITETSYLFPCERYGALEATAAYQRLCELARNLGADDPRGMDARRADLHSPPKVATPETGADPPEPDPPPS